MSAISGKSEITKRAGALLLAVLTAFAALLGRIFLIQTVYFDKYLKKVEDQISTQSPTRAERGVIYDRNGEALAVSTTSYRIYISPSSIRAKQNEMRKKGIEVDYSADIARGLSDILDIDYDEVYRQTSYTKYLERTIARDVSGETADRVRELIAREGYYELVHVAATSKRYYPYGSLASAVLGFTDADGNGSCGLESSYNSALSGTDGYYVTARDSYGNEMPGEYELYVPSVDGSSLNTTLDLYLQSVLEEELMSALSDSDAKNRASGIVINVKTGAILAMATVPGFDLNEPRSLNDYYAQLLSSDKIEKGDDGYAEAYTAYLLEMWRNKAVSDSYIPGSTFKIISSAAALSEGKVSLEGDRVFCGGSLSLYGHTIHCHKRLGHGSLTFAQGLTQSCNVWFMTLGERLGVNAFYDYFKSFGYLEKTGIELPGEASSVIRTQSSMTGLDLAIYSFGQNFNVTPIQHITAIAAVANGGYLLEPYLVESVVSADGSVTYEHESTPRRRVVSEEVCRTITSILEEGTSGDGGAKNAYVAGYKIAAKTGTSEKKGTDIRVDGVKAYVCSCVAYAPADDPEIAVLMMVDEPSRGILYGSTVAAPYVGSFLGRALPYLGFERDESAVGNLPTPSFVGMSTAQASEYAKNYGYETVTLGDGAYITSQSPAAETLIDKTNKKIILYTGNAAPSDTVSVPSLTGMSAYAANKIIINSNLNLCIEGVGEGSTGIGATVVAQSPEPGTAVPPGTVVRLTLRYLDGSE